MRYGRRQFMQFCTAAVLASLTTVALAADPAPKVSIKTSMGEIILEVYPDKAPKTVENFLTYVKSGFYNGTIFHCVINGFMVQGGGYDQSMKEKPTRAPIQNEAKNGLKNRAYTIAMARTPDPHSASAQFFASCTLTQRFSNRRCQASNAQHRITQQSYGIFIRQDQFFNGCHHWVH